MVLLIGMAESAARIVAVLGQVTGRQMAMWWAMKWDQEMVEMWALGKDVR